MLAAAWTAVILVQLPFAWTLRSDVERFIERTEASDGAVPLFAYDAIGYAAVVVQIAAWIVTAVWLHRAVINAEIMRGEHGRSLSPVWAWIGWIVPVVSLWFPYLVVRDLRRSLGLPNGALIGWWLLWIGSLVATSSQQLVDYALESADGLWPLSLLGPMATVQLALMVAALVFWWRIVTQLGRVQDSMIAGDPVPPAVPDQLA